MIGTKIKLAIVAAVLLGTFGSGWKVRDAFCDAAEARAQLAAERTKHDATRTDLAAAKVAVLAANAALEEIEDAARTREETIRERQTQPAPAGAARCKLGVDGVGWLRRIAPD